MFALNYKELTGFGVDGKVRLPVQNAVDHPRAVSIRGVVCICRCDLKNRHSWGKKERCVSV